MDEDSVQKHLDLSYVLFAKMRMLLYASIVQIFSPFSVAFCSRRGEHHASLKDVAFDGRLKFLLGQVGTGTFFTQENVDVNTWHVTSRWWRSHLLGRLPKDFNQSDVNKLCVKRRDSCQFFDSKEWVALPSVKPGSWGTCAVIGYGSNLLRTPRGDTIDKYDTVIRLGMVELSKYAVEAGVKNTFVYIRDRKLRKSRGNFIDEDKNGFRASQLLETQRPQALIYSSFRDNPTEGWATITFGGDLTLTLERALKQIMKEVTYSGLPPDPSSGLILPMVLLFSGHCTKIGIFGISSTMGPRYWEIPKPRVKTKSFPKRGGFKIRNLSENHNTKLEAIIWKKIEKFMPPIINIDVEFYD